MILNRLGTAMLGMTLLVIGGFAWSLQLRPPLEVHAQGLTMLPPSLQDWTSQDFPLEQSVESILHADANVQRLYARPRGERVWVYVGYYGTERGGRPQHTPAACYPSSGWQIVRQRTIAEDPVRGLRANEYVVEKGDQRDLVHFWYRSYRRTGMLGAFDLSVDHLLGRLQAGRADGALVRISTPIRGDDEAAARNRLAGFAVAFDSQLAAQWPTETPAGG